MDVRQTNPSKHNYPSLKLYVACTTDISRTCGFRDTFFGRATVSKLYTAFGSTPFIVGICIFLLPSVLLLVKSISMFVVQRSMKGLPPGAHQGVDDIRAAR